MAAVRYARMAAAHRSRPGAASEWEQWFALTRVACSMRVAAAAAGVAESAGQAPSVPAADRRKLALRSKAMALPEAWACR
jgi:hypothetical protein